MDSTSLLDSALFQLTPTRTRFDLVLFCGSKKEKVASGLFEPFISQLKFARDQISRGGYSISLRPPSSYSPWFTKSTFERFVRFVNTPAILERFVSLEKEILQIEHAIQANESGNANGPEQLDDASNSGVNGNLRKSNDSSKLRKEFEKNNEDAEEENSKIQLQRLLESRKTVLRREQAMAYARGVAAGFEIDSMDDLISFAGAFGAARLREACINYKELWKKKHGDGLWIAELAAVEACAPSEMPLLGSTGIVLTNEVAALTLNGTNSTPSNASSDYKDDKLPNSDQIASAVPKFQAPMPWPNQIPQYFYPLQQPPPYQGYPFPMQPFPHQYPGNMPWPSKGKSSKKKGTEDFEGDGSSGSSESDSESDDSASSLEDQEQKHSRTVKDYRRPTKNRKKASKTVIIRNINYITPEGRNEDTPGDELTDRISIKETVDAAVGLLGKEKRAAAKRGSGDDIVEDTPEERKSNENWDAFQNLLIRNNEKSADEAVNLRSLDVGEEHFTLRSSVLGAKSEGTQMKEKVAADSFILTQRSKENGGAKFEHFESEESANILPGKRDSTDESMLLPKRSETLGNESKDIFYAVGAETLVIKSGRGEDWFVADRAGKLESFERTSLDGNCILTTEGSCQAKVDKIRKQEFVDDSFMVQSSLTGDDLYDSQWRPGISIVADLAMASDMENGYANMQKDKHEVVDSCEPNDLCMILERNSEAAEDSWAVDYRIDLSVVEANARLSSIGSSQEQNKDISSGEKTNNVKNAEARGKTDSRSRIPGRPLNKNRTETMSKSAKKPSIASRTMSQKSKLEKEEEMRKRMEDLLIQRQKRIAERTAATAASSRASLERSTGQGSITSDKNKTMSASRDANRVTPVRVRTT